MTAAVPRLLDIQNEPAARFFSRQAIVKTAITAMTNFENGHAQSAEPNEDEALGI
jgi:hypothetical protein